MFKTKLTEYSKLFVTMSFALVLVSCGGSSGGTLTPPVNPPINPGNPPSAPVGVQVVSGDSEGIDVQNTISWTFDPAATSYTVYWDNAPGVTENSSVVVPAFSGTRYVVHSGVDVLAGNNYYYRVRATSAGGDSALSDEIAGTPQAAITNNALNDVAWNGVDTLVAVGDSGVILSSPNATTDPWVDVSLAAAPQPLTGITWEGVNSQFLIVGAGNTVLTGDGTNWVVEDLSNLPGASNLEDVAWIGDKYIVVGNNGTILTSNVDGSAWVEQDPGPNLGNTSLNAVAASNDRIVVVGTNGTIVTSVDAVTWEEQPPAGNNDLNDVTWDGSQFVVVGSNDTVLTSPDGLTWTSHIPGTSDINLVVVTQFDSGLPQTPVLGAAGSSGTFVLDPDADPGSIVRTGTTRMLDGMTWVDDAVAPAYFVLVGSDGTVLTAQY
jgi:photosystem II stability/assembly factor-like uncharacterized protein